MRIKTELRDTAMLAGAPAPDDDALLQRLRAAVLDGVRDPDAPDLTLRQLALLLTIEEGSMPPTVRHFAPSFRISKPAVTRAMDALEAAGFARRRPDPEDRRSVLLEVTAMGRRHIARLGRAAAQ